MISFWEKDIFFKQTDVVIAGAGFNGLWMAFFLKKYRPNLSITILEKGFLPTGASTKNAGFSCFGSPSELLSNINEMGLEKAIYWASQRYEGTEIIRQYFGNSIEFEACGGYEVYDKKEVFDKCSDSLPKLNQLLEESTGEPNLFSIENDLIEKFGFQNFKYLIKNKAEGSIHSGKLIQALIKYLQNIGVNILLGVELSVFEVLDNQVVIKTPFAEIKAKHLCLTLNAFLPKILPNTDLYPGRGQVLITEPLPNLPFKGTFHYDEGFFYFRHYQNRLLLGGGRNLDFKTEKSDAFELNDEIFNHLEALIRTSILPNEPYKIAQRWVGIMAFDESKTPIAEVRNPQLSICARMNGMGVALAPILTKKLSKEILRYF
jgi:gamma-glutamylputrescine oxidase